MAQVLVQVAAVVVQEEMASEKQLQVEGGRMAAGVRKFFLNFFVAGCILTRCPFSCM